MAQIIKACFSACQYFKRIGGTVRPLDAADRRLGDLLGLGELNHLKSCWGYQTCCACPACRKREENDGEPVPLAPKACGCQPWEPESRRAAA